MRCASACAHLSGGPQELQNGPGMRSGAQGLAHSEPAKTHITGRVVPAAIVLRPCVCYVMFAH
eukprot:CAMPEP_0174704986 /NCGR_PEP_ID=MMETSP1094-20130205/8373_1 /TAXON_ID=156173 /ORGANISM="Chrysochromulina brevifilum, Strain UTEX LB 985" /LENGTH=62 /DNA_ID=CAMNT_0015903093 /DNA_START=309 /DNA_END=497 /DNA_ORIENTATION=-